MLKARHQAVVRNAIEEPLKIEVDHDFTTFTDVLTGLCDGRMATALRTKAMAGRVKCGVVMRIQHVKHRLSDNALDDVWDTEAALTAATLFYPDAAYRAGAIAATKELLVQPYQYRVQVLAHVLNGLTVWTGCTLVLGDALESKSQVG